MICMFYSSLYTCAPPPLRPPTSLPPPLRRPLRYPPRPPSFLFPISLAAIPRCCSPNPRFHRLPELSIRPSASSRSPCGPWLLVAWWAQVCPWVDCARKHNFLTGGGRGHGYKVCLAGVGLLTGNVPVLPSRISGPGAGAPSARGSRRRRCRGRARRSGLLPRTSGSPSLSTARGVWALRARALGAPAPGPEMREGSTVVAESSRARGRFALRPSGRAPAVGCLAACSLRHPTRATRYPRSKVREQQDKRRV